MSQYSNNNHDWDVFAIYKRKSLSVYGALLKTMLEQQINKYISAACCFNDDSKLLQLSSN